MLCRDRSMVLGGDGPRSSNANGDAMRGVLLHHRNSAGAPGPPLQVYDPEEGFAGTTMLSPCSWWLWLSAGTRSSQALHTLSNFYSSKLDKPVLAAVPPEEVSHSSWSCAACRNPSPGHLEADCRAAVGQGAGSSFTSRGQRCPSTVGLTQARESCPFTPRVPSPLGASMLESEGPNHGCILLRCHGSAQHVQLAQQGLRFTTENWACLLGKMLEMMEKSIPSVAVSRITPCSLCHALAGSVSLQCFEEQRSGKGFPK
ncbi:hypothetical protein AV530_019467 [Patagioenas fasciata monilis]|uniref:Uncharacterized protein n=1 Tax=Patagioenas fasciata monilis TaxID=372326 RepID=A0A1V4JE30_PATFA|nr:hypothetical protein AV530_019467 [Patagioenas fasciata monilis]